MCVCVCVCVCVNERITAPRKLRKLHVCLIFNILFYLYFLITVL